MSVGYQITQTAHSVADFAYHKPYEFKNWRENSNYKICLSTKNEKSLLKLHKQFIDNGAQLNAFREPNLGNQMTAITLLGEPQFKKYTGHLPLAGKEYRNIAQLTEQRLLNSQVVGSNPTVPTNVEVA